MGMGEFNSDDHHIYYCGWESLRRNGAAPIVNKTVWSAVLRCNLANNRMISVHFQGKSFNITVTWVYVPTTNAKEAEQFYENLQHLLELTPKKDVLFSKGVWNAKVVSQQIPGNKRQVWPWSTKWKRAKANKFCQENMLVIANTLFQQHKRWLYTWTSVQFSCSVMSNYLWPHEPQHARPPCPSPTPGVHPNPCPLSRSYHSTILYSVVPFSSCLQSFPASGSFPVSQLFASGGQSTGVSASTSVLPMNTQDWSPLGWTGWISLQSKGLSRVFSNTTIHFFFFYIFVQKHQFFGTQLSL